MSFRSLKKKTAYEGSKLEDIEDVDTTINAQKQLERYFAGIEEQFAQVCLENQQLKAKLLQMERQLKYHDDQSKQHEGMGNMHAFELDGAWQYLRKNPSQFSKKVMNKYKEQTNKIVSSFRPVNLPPVHIKLINRYSGHKDGIWDVCYCSWLKGKAIIGTASNDKTARIWQADGKNCLLKYLGHSGSVNSIRFHPQLPLVLTASGDRSTHVWSCDVPENDEIFPDETITHSEEDFSEGEQEENVAAAVVVKTPQRTLDGHSSVVTTAEWLNSGTQAVTASWDRTALVWDAEVGTIMHTLSGHEEELTHTAVHPSQALIVTCSKDTTFRVWDFRTSIHSVNVYQGHTATVSCAVFTSHTDCVISASDDCTAKVWDLRNMRTPITTIHCDASVNRLAVSENTHHTLAIPFDNRHVRLYDMQGNYLERLPRRSQPGHQRMVCCAVWATDDKPANLFTCGFDNRTIAWKVGVEFER